MHLHRIRPSRALTLLALCLAPLPVCAEGVRIVTPTGALDFPDVQSAVDAAAPGAVLLVAPGSYPGFTVEGKPLWVVAPQGAEVDGPVVVRLLPPGPGVALVGLTVAPETPAAPFSDGGAALRAEQNAAPLRVQDCALVGAVGQGDGQCEPSGHVDGYPASRLVDCASVGFVGCTLVGGRGASIPSSLLGCYEPPGGDGGDALHASGAPVTLHGCALVGGEGGEAGIYAGDGGAGFRAPDFGVYAAGCSLQGGDGGFAWDFIYVEPGDGGDGVALGAAQGSFLDCTFAGGEAGDGIVCCDGAPGAPISGGVITHFAGAARLLEAPAVSADAAALPLEATGAPGDALALVGASAPAFQPVPAFSGVWLVTVPSLLGAWPLFVLPPGGAASFELRVPGLGGGPPAIRAHLQLFARPAGGAPVVGAARQIVVLDREAGPDCDGNGTNDVLDVLAGAPDCDADLVPDLCQIASGQTPDCNANGVPDACDIEAGTSLDVDGDGVPDECQLLGLTWWVDDDAAPGGDGSAAAPFRTIGAALAVAFTSDTVVVRDGLYTGPENRDLDFGGRALVVRSENGPAACTIDCQDQGRAFRFASLEGPAARLEGFTIRDGFAFVSGEQSGGGVRVQGGSRPTIRGCVFISCRALGVGGGLSVQEAAPVVEGCDFIANHAGIAGGALHVSNVVDVVVARCRFVDNTTVLYGGAVYAIGLDPFEAGTARLLLEGCLFSGNVANTAGGAVYARGTLFTHARLALLESTFFGNAAGGRGGALFVGDEQRSVLVGNSILWGDAAPSGPELALDGGIGSPPAVQVEHCDVEGGAAAAHVTNGSLTFGAGNLDLDPLFVAPGALDLALSAGSPCVDAGANALLPPDAADVDRDGDLLEPVPLDLVDNPRRVDDPAAPDTGAGLAPLVDLGALERRP